jgi:RNA polymerase sigma factor (sigma-70 family)
MLIKCPDMSVEITQERTTLNTEPDHDIGSNVSDAPNIVDEGVIESLYTVEMPSEEDFKFIAGLAHEIACKKFGKQMGEDIAQDWLFNRWRDRKLITTDRSNENRFKSFVRSGIVWMAIDHTRRDTRLHHMPDGSRLYSFEGYDNTDSVETAAPVDILPEASTEDRVLDKLTDPDILKLINSLPPRARQVFTGIAEGLTDTEIAEKYDIGPKTVKTIRFKALKKINARLTSKEEDSEIETSEAA